MSQDIRGECCSPVMNKRVEEYRSEEKQRKYIFIEEFVALEFS